MTDPERRPPAETVTECESSADVAAKHTAVRPSRMLCATYAFESLVTGLPLCLVDLLCSGGSLLAAGLLASATVGAGISSGVWLQLPVLLLLQTMMMSLHQLYPGAGVSAVAELRGVVRSIALAYLILSVMNVVFGQLPRLEFSTFAAAAAISSVTLPIARRVARNLLSKTSWWGVRLILLGRHDDCQATYQQLRRRRASGFVAVGYVCSADEARRHSGSDRLLLGCYSQAPTIARQRFAPVAGLASPDETALETGRLIFQFPSVVWIDFAGAARRGFDMSLLPQMFRTRVNLPFLRFTPRIVKRCTDLAVCIPTLVLLALPMLVIAGLIKLASPGPVLFGHRRIGQHGRPFRAWKFRTMVENGEEVLERHLRRHPEARREWQESQKLRRDPRVIRGIGAFLRTWSLDELPQLWNVLRGEMSLVGPRPIVYAEIGRYGDSYLSYSHMLPGITGLWQISGRNHTSYATRVAMDEHYARHWTPWLDFWVLIKTPAVVLHRHGAF